MAEGSAVVPVRIRVEVVHAEPRRATLKSYRLPPTATVADVLRLAAADPDFATVDFASPAVGVFGRPAGPDQPLRDGDRVEIYRGPAVDPKSARRARASEGRGAGRPSSTRSCGRP
jgi:putative ubiquitin-RnfH superfamily antitoxin RatB of RatAB toxin-antitoxin module